MNFQDLFSNPLFLIGVGMFMFGGRRFSTMGLLIAGGSLLIGTPIGAIAGQAAGPIPTASAAEAGGVSPAQAAGQEEEQFFGIL